MGYYGPLSIYGFAILTAVVNKFLIGPVVRAVFKQEASEGDFRYTTALQWRVSSSIISPYLVSNWHQPNSTVDTGLRILGQTWVNAVNIFYGGDQFKLFRTIPAV